MRTGIAALAATLLLGCAAETARRPEERRPTPQNEDALRRVDAAEAALRQAYEELLSVKAATTPGCPRACELATNVCALAQRICTIAAEYPPDDPVAHRCEDGRARCARARAAVAGPCGCDATPPG